MIGENRFELKKKKESFSRGNKHKIKEKYLLTKS